jgi:PTH1 family peptidyl-tRNA hydrolase
MFGKNSRNGAPLWIVAFLGNPGREYAMTRHNAGWLAADSLCAKKGVRIDRARFKALTGFGELGGRRVFLMKPQTYMNLSGDAVAPAAAFYKIPRTNVIVVHDDIALPPGRLRIKRGGSDGGHNGIKSLISRLGGNDFIRVKIGVGEPTHPDYDRIDWVIGKLTDADAALLRKAADIAVDAVEEIIKSGVDAAMNIYNGTAGEVK